MDAVVEYCGLSLSTEVEIPELRPPTADLPPDLRLVRIDAPGPAPDPWIHHWLNGSSVVLSLGWTDGSHVLRFGDGRVFKFHRETRTVSWSTRLDCAARHQLLDQVLPRVLDDLGHLMIHASAVNTLNGVVIFIGDTGRGKSTLAASFESAGFELLSDDCMRLTVDPDGAIAGTPTYRSLRLWADSADAVMETSRFEPMAANSDKRRLELPGTPPVGYSRVVAICALTARGAGASAIEFDQVAPARAVALLLAQCFRLDPTDTGATRQTFERCAEVIDRIPMVELGYPRQYARLPDVREAVLSRIASGDWKTSTSR